MVPHILRCAKTASGADVPDVVLYSASTGMRREAAAVSTAVLQLPVRHIEGIDPALRPPVPFYYRILG